MALKFLARKNLVDLLAVYKYWWEKFWQIANRSPKFSHVQYFIAHTLINHLKWQLRYANNFSMCAYIRYRNTLNWLCLGRIIVTSLRYYLKMHLMFLSNNSLQDPFYAGAYWLVIISVAATHVRLVIFPDRPLFRQKLSCSKQGSKKHTVRKQKIFEEKIVTKIESRLVHYPWKFILRKLQI